MPRSAPPSLPLATFRFRHREAQDDYFVAYALDLSGLAMPLAGGEIHPKNLIEFTGKDNVRLTLLIRDSRTGRIIPGLKPQASLIAADGKLYGPGELLFSCPWLYHYGRNARIPRKGLYTLACTLMPGLPPLGPAERAIRAASRDRVRKRFIAARKEGLAQ